MRESYRWLVFSLALGLLAAPGFAAMSASPTPVTSLETETSSPSTVYRTYHLSDGSGKVHEFTVGFSAVTGEFVSISGEEGKDVLLGSREGTAAALNSLLDMVDRGVNYLYVNSEKVATSSDSSIHVINQSVAAATADLPDPQTYDAVSSFSLPDGGRALLFWNQGEITETRVFSQQPPAQQPQLPIEIEIECTITWTPQEGFRINCKVRIRIRNIQLPGISFN